MLNLTYPSAFSSLSLWVHETDRTISVSCSKAFSLLLNSFLWLLPALTLTIFWILKYEPQAWICYLIHFSLSALCGGKLTSLILLTTFPVCLFLGSPYPYLSACQERCLHWTTLPQWPPALIQELCYMQPVLLMIDDPHSFSLWLLWGIGCRMCSERAPLSDLHPLTWLSHQPPSATKVGHSCPLSMDILH